MGRRVPSERIRGRVNIYEGKFPIEGGDTGEDGFKGIAPVAQFPPKCLRPLRRGGERVGVVQRLVSRGHLHPAQARRAAWRAIRKAPRRPTTLPSRTRKSA
jgi:hypothetical protein